MLIKFSIQSLLTKRSRSLITLAGVSISVALFVSIILILKSAQGAFRKPLEETGSDMIVQLQGEPCVWPLVKLPTNLNPIPLEVIDKIRSLNEVASVDGSLISWAFSSPAPLQIQYKQLPPGVEHKDIVSLIARGELEGEPCDYGPPGSFCDYVGDPASSVSPISSVEYPGPQMSSIPLVVAGVNLEPQEIGSIKNSDLKNIQGRYFTREDKYVAILDRDFARTRNLKPEDSIDVGQKSFKVIGVIDSGYDARIAGAQVFIPLKTAIEMIGRGNIVDIIFIRLKSVVDINIVKEKIKKILHNDDVTIITSNNYLSTVAGLSSLTQGLALAIFFIVILISFLFIAKTAFGSVLERSSEIGMLRAIGWRNRDITRLIIMENFILGLFGGVVGFILGYLVSFFYKANLLAMLLHYLNPYPPWSQYLVNKTLQAPVLFSANIFLTTILLAVAIEILSGFFAAKKILRLTPADAMR
ncbi:MAG: ABC transporter permease [Candidatus Omnitrophica bacterium]|nr:ABC transporter permease [Candidatus Omnitrophota bacterium]